MPGSGAAFSRLQFVAMNELPGKSYLRGKRFLDLGH